MGDQTDEQKSQEAWCILYAQNPICKGNLHTGIFVKAFHYTLPASLPSSIHTVSWKNISEWSLSIALVLAPSFPRQEKLVYQVLLSFSRGNYLQLQNHGSLFSLMPLSWAGDSEARPQSGLGSLSLKLPEARPSMRPGPGGHLREVTTPSGLWQLSPTFPSGSLSEGICSMCGQESHWIFDHRKVS